MNALTRFDKVVISTVALLVVASAAVVLLGRGPDAGTRILFLAPAYGGVQDLWVAPLDNPAQARQLTATSVGIYDYAVSPDGRHVAIAERDSNSGLTDIALLDVQQGITRPLTNCAQERADCSTPAFRPDGRVIAYQRSELNVDIAGMGGIGVTRVWLVDVTRTPYTNRPLFSDSQIVGHSPVWSADGSRLAFYSADLNNLGILIYQFDAPDPQNALQFVPSRYGAMGALSPNGAQLVFPELTDKGGAMYAHLRLADLGGASFRDLTDPAEPIDDITAVWHPDGRRLAVARRYNDDRYTRGHQVYLVDSADGSATPLVVDERYNSSAFRWNKDGTMLLLQRFPLLNEDGTVNDSGRPEVWVYFMETGELRQIAVNALFPQWLEGD